MANMKKVGQAIVVTSVLKVEDIKRVARFAPKSLKLVDSDKKEYFVIAAGSESIGQYGVSFKEQNAEGFAQLTLMGKSEVTKKELAETYGHILNNLAKVEEQALDALAGVNETLEAVEDSIVVE